MHRYYTMEERKDSEKEEVKIVDLSEDDQSMIDYLKSKKVSSKA